LHGRTVCPCSAQLTDTENSSLSISCAGRMLSFDFCVSKIVFDDQSLLTFAAK